MDSIEQSLTPHIILCKILHEKMKLGKGYIMAINLAIDKELLDAALKAGGLKSKKATVNQALSEYIKRRKTAEIIELFGNVDFDLNYDYKEGRKPRS